MCLTNSKFDQVGVLATSSRCSIIIENPLAGIAPMSLTKSKFDLTGALPYSLIVVRAKTAGPQPYPQI